MSNVPKWAKPVFWTIAAVIIVGCAGSLVWSLFRPPVKDGPMPPEPAPMAAPRDAG